MTTLQEYLAEHEPGKPKPQGTSLEDYLAERQMEPAVGGVDEYLASRPSGVKIAPDPSSPPPLEPQSAPAKPYRGPSLTQGKPPTEAELLQMRRDALRAKGGKDEYGRGVHRGVATMGAAQKSLLAMGAGALGKKGFQRRMLQEAGQLTSRAGRPELAASVPRVEDIRSVKDAGKWALGQGGEQTPVLGSLALGAGAGGAPAAIAAAIGLETGGVYQDVTERSGKAGGKEALVAAAHGTAAGLLEALPVMRLFKKLGVGKDATKGVLRRVGSWAAQQAGTEAVTEGLQTVVEQSAREWVDKNHKMFSKENLSELLNATATGALMGGGMGALAAPMSPTTPQAPSQAPEAAPRAQFPTKPQGLSPIEKIVEEQIVRKPKGIPFFDWAKSQPAALQRRFVNELSVIERGLKKAGIELDWKKPGGLLPKENPMELATMYKGKEGGQARGWAIYHTTDIYGRPNGESLMDIIAPVSSDQKTWEKFSRYHYARVAQNRWRLGNNPGITLDQANSLVGEMENPKWRDASDRVTQWFHRGLDYMQEAGAISKEENAAIKAAHPVYAPLMRDIKGRGHRGAPGRYVETGKGLKRLKKGGDIPTIDWMQNGLAQMRRQIGIANRVKVTNALVDLVEQNPALAESGFMTKVDKPIKPVQVAAKELAAAVKREGGEFDVIEAGLSPDTPLLFFRATQQVYGKQIVPIIRKGKTEFYKVDPDLESTLRHLEEVKLPAFVDLFFGKPARLRRLGATGLSPTFGLAFNPFRDTLFAFTTAEHAILGPISTAEGLFEDLRDIWAHKPGEPTIAEEFKAQGGEMSFGVGHDRVSTSKAAQELLEKSRGVTGPAFYHAKHPVEAARAILSVTELAPRVAETKHAKKFGEKQWGKGDPSAQVYAFNAGQDLTLNFTRAGSWGRYLNQAVPFFNAGVQGPAKILNTVKKHPVKFVLKGIGSMTLFSTALWWHNRDEEWYKNLTAREKAEFFHIPIPGTKGITATGEPIIVRLPVPFEIGYFFKSLPEMFLDSRYQDDPEEFKESIGWMLKRLFPPVLPVPIDIGYHLAMNKDWLERPIEPKYSEDQLLRKDRDKPYTTRLMKELANLTYNIEGLFSDKPSGASPAMLEYFANSLTGSLYGRVTQPIEKLLGLPENEKEKKWTVHDIPVMGRIIAREPYAPRRKIEKFYQEMQRANQVSGSEKKEKGRPPVTSRAKAARYRRSATRMSVLWKKLEKESDPKRRKAIYKRMERLIDRARD